MTDNRKILVPTDFSATAMHAYHYALLLAGRLDATVHLLHVVYPIIDNFDTPLVGMPATQQQVETAKASVQDFAQEGLNQMEDRLENKPQVMTRVEVGGAIVVIQDIARREGFPMIVMGTQGEHNAWDKLLGSIAAGVVTKAPCPIVVVPEHTALVLPKKVAYATDLLEADPYEIWRAMKLLAPLNTSLEVVHFGEAKPHGRHISLSDLKDFFRENLPDLQVGFHQFKKSSLPEDLSRFTSRYQIDLLVMYRVQRSFWEKLFHRSRTKELAKVTEVPLLVV